MDNMFEWIIESAKAYCEQCGDITSEHDLNEGLCGSCCGTWTDPAGGVHCYGDDPTKMYE
jgi:hypothetical protein